MGTTRIDDVKRAGWDEREEAEAAFTFEIYGAYAMNRHHHWKRDDA